jgi:hypothetical protein
MRNGRILQFCMPQACLAFGLGRHDFWGTDTSEGHRIVGEIFSRQLCCLFEGRILSQTPAEFRGRVRERVSEVRIHPSPPSSPRFPRALQKARKYCARSRIFFCPRAPEKLRFCRHQLIYPRFSLSRIEPVPFGQFPLLPGLVFSAAISPVPFAFQSPPIVQTVDSRQ